MFLLYIVLFIVYIMSLNFFLNEEILLFFTFSLFFFIIVQNFGLIVKKTINLSRYKIYNKFIKASLTLIEILKLNEFILKLNKFYIILKFYSLIYKKGFVSSKNKTFLVKKL